MKTKLQIALIREKRKRQKDVQIVKRTVKTPLPPRMKLNLLKYYKWDVN